MDKLEKALSDAGWDKETIECFLKSDPVIPSQITLTTFEVDSNIEKTTVVEYPRIADSSSLVFKVSK